MRYILWVLKVTRWVKLTMLLVGIGAVSSVACGGRSETSPDEGESTGSHGSSGSDDPSGSGTGSDDDDGDGLDDALELGECVKGWPVFEADCPWLGSDNLCYATKAAACACLCPRDTRSTCISGLPGGPDDETAVSCF